MRRLVRHLVFLVCIFVALQLFAQNDPKPATFPKIHFTFDHPGLPVTHYDTDIAADGTAHYQSRIKAGTESSDEGVTRDFKLSEETRARIFALCKSANYLRGSFDYTKHKIAFTGTKT